MRNRRDVDLRLHTSNVRRGGDVRGARGYRDSSPQPPAAPMTRRLCSGGALAAAWLSASLVAQPQRIELRGEGFVLRGHLSSKTLTAVACDLETAVSALRPPAAGNAQAPKVEAVDGARGMREWMPQFKQHGRGNPLGA